MKSANCHTSHVGTFARTPVVASLGSPLRTLLACFRFLTAFSNACVLKAFPTRSVARPNRFDSRFRTAALHHIILYHANIRTCAHLGIPHRGPPSLLPYDIRGFPAAFPRDKPSAAFSPPTNQGPTKPHIPLTIFYSFFIFS